MPRLTFEFMSSKTHQGHIALSEPMASIVQPSPPLTPTIIRPSSHLILFQVLSGGKHRQISHSGRDSAGWSMFNGRLAVKRPPASSEPP